MDREVKQAGCIITCDGGVVLRRTAAGEFVFPKGHVEPGETLQETAVRETAEETGLAVEIVEPAGEITFAISGETRRVVYYLARCVDKLSSWPEHLGHDTFVFPVEEVLEELAFASNRDLWTEAYDAVKELLE
ncbi:MAG: NUDIX domain-containing protein [Dehalococcoidales bacterium]|nr:NUDIX domain-containing protein [Dehalococcoidales bacterium]